LYAAWVCQRPSLNHTKKKIRPGHGLGEIPKILEFPFNIFATAEASDFKFAMLFGVSKAHHKILPRRKRGRGPGLGDLPNIWGSHLIFLQQLKIAGRWALPRPVKNPIQKKSGRGHGLGEHEHNFGLACVQS